MVDKSLNLKSYTYIEKPFSIGSTKTIKANIPFRAQYQQAKNECQEKRKKNDWNQLLQFLPDDAAADTVIVRLNKFPNLNGSS